MDKIKTFAEDILQVFAIGICVTIGLLPIIALILFIASVTVDDTPKPKTCYVTEWSERQRDGQTWREPKTTICVEGEK